MLAFPFRSFQPQLINGVLEDFESPLKVTLEHQRDSQQGVGLDRVAVLLPQLVELANYCIRAARLSLMHLLPNYELEWDNYPYEQPALRKRSKHAVLIDRLHGFDGDLR